MPRVYASAYACLENRCLAHLSFAFAGCLRACCTALTVRSVALTMLQDLTPIVSQKLPMGEDSAVPTALLLSGDAVMRIAARA